MRKLFVVFTLLVPSVAMAGLFGPPPRPFVAPGRLFSVQVPPRWAIVLGKDHNTVEFRSPGGDAKLFVRHITVPAHTNPRELMLNAIDQRLKKLPDYKEIGRRDVTVAGQPAAAVTATYDYQGNIQYPRAVEELFVVVGTDGFVFHFQCFEPAAGRLAPLLNRFYQTFMPRPSANVEGPFSDKPTVPMNQPDKLPDINKVPF